MGFSRSHGETLCFSVEIGENSRIEMRNPLNFSESGWWGRILSAMKVLIPILIGMLVVGCGKNREHNPRRKKAYWDL